MKSRDSVADFEGLIYTSFGVCRARPRLDFAE
jgi:hypothetical protein